MMKKYTYILIVILFICGVGFIIHKAGKSKDQVTYYQLEDRRGPLALEPEWAGTKVKVQKLYRSIQDFPKDTKAP